MINTEEQTPMSKAGIITLFGYNNYGNRLQNYATQEVLKSLGYEVVTIVNEPTDQENPITRLKRAKIKSVVRLMGRIIVKARHKVYKTKVEKDNIRLQQLRIQSFFEFTKKNIVETDFKITPNSIPNEFGSQYNVFVSGSDQVWNPNFRNGSPIDFLTFAPKEKRVAYSASFGVSEIPNKFREKYQQWLKEMAYISVREESGAEIVKQLTGRVVPVLVDPTLMLTKENWQEIIETGTAVPNGSFILTYFLGQLTPEYEEWIKGIAKRNNLYIIRMADIKEKDHYTKNPGQFLGYINDCSLFMTDSFHGAVFSILFEKPFVVFDRVDKTPSMNSRIDTLLSKFKLESRKWENISNKDDVFEIDFSHVPQILAKERAKAYDFLREALSVQESEQNES